MTRARVLAEWDGTNGQNNEDALEGYDRVIMRKKDFETLKEDMELTGETISEIGRRISSLIRFDLIMGIFSKQANLTVYFRTYTLRQSCLNRL